MEKYPCGCRVEIDQYTGAAVELCARHMCYAEAIAEALAEEHGACTVKPLPE